MNTKTLTFAVVAIALMVSGFPISQVFGILLICYGAGKIAGEIAGKKL